jgi:cyclopropane fatty-acyl-phospholipid synthase-like methyltransferase
MSGTTNYLQRANPEFEAILALRTAAKEGAFFLAHLRPGMRVLDVGCGPGSITLGLAEAVGPGEAVGIDLQASQVAHSDRPAYRMLSESALLTHPWVTNQAQALERKAVRSGGSV